MSGPNVREARTATFLQVRIRGDEGWCEAIVCNISAHGMMLRGEGLPGRGKFVEIAGGSLYLAGQVRWSLAGRCGVRTREMIDLAALVGPEAAPERKAAGSAPAPRYTQGPRSRPASDGRALGRALDFGLCLALLAAGAWLLGTSVEGLLGRPLQQIDSQLASAQA